MGIYKAIIFIFIASLFSTLGNLLIKKSRNITSDIFPDFLNFVNTLFVIALVCYCLNLYFFMRSLEFFPVSVGYPLLASLGFIMLAISASVLFGESLSIIQFSGLLTIIIGIFMLLFGVKTL